MEEMYVLFLCGYVLHIGKREAEEASAYTGQPWESQSFCLHVSFQDKTKTTCRGKQNVSLKKKNKKTFLQNLQDYDCPKIRMQRSVT